MIMWWWGNKAMKHTTHIQSHGENESNLVTIVRKIPLISTMRKPKLWFSTEDLRLINGQWMGEY